MWKCIEGCKAECCGIFPFQERFFLKLKDRMQVEPLEIISSDGLATPLTDDAYCAFLNRETRQCAIYDVRPKVCREYGQAPRLPCPYVSLNGMPRTAIDSFRM